MPEVTARKCGVCGAEFEAKRSDAYACSATCRQRRRRAERTPIRSRPEWAKPKDGTHNRTKTQRMERLLESMIGPVNGATEHWRDVLHGFDAAGALADPDFQLDEWDRKLTETIQFLTQVRRAIRDEQERHG